MSRGGRREDFSKDDVDRQDFLKRTAEACREFRFQVQAQADDGEFELLRRGVVSG